MHLPTFLSIALLSLSPIVSAVPNTSSLDRCGTRSPDLSSALSSSPSKRDIPHPRNFTTPSEDNWIEIPVVYHKIASNFPAAELTDGQINETNVKAQHVALNAAYAPYFIRFNYEYLDHDLDANLTTRTWYYAAIGSAPMRTELTKAAKKGGYSTLNVYMVEGYGIVLEYANFPEWSPSPLQWYSDGVYLNSNSVPGKVGDNGTIRNGKSLVRHWLGLRHVFNDDHLENGTCEDPDNDGIGDTPLQLTPSRGCPIGKDSCPGFPGVDNTQNYMDYSDDSCMFEFTPNQVEKMYSSWYNMRLPRANESRETVPPPQLGYGS